MVQSHVITSRTHVHDQCIGFGLGVSTSDTIEMMHGLREKYLEQRDVDSLEVDTTNQSGGPDTMFFTHHHQWYPEDFTPLTYLPTYLIT